MRLEFVRHVGKQYAKTGTIDEKLLAKICAPMIHEEVYSAIYNKEMLNPKHGQPFMQRLSVFLIYPVTTEIPVSVPACVYKMTLHKTLIREINCNRQIINIHCERIKNQLRSHLFRR